MAIRTGIQKEGSSNIKDGSITESHIAPKSIDAEHFKDGALDGLLSSDLLNITAAATTTDVLTTFVTGDTAATNRFVLNGDGKQEWGGGAGAVDTNLYRSAADTLKTDDKFVVGTGKEIEVTTGVAGIDSATIAFSALAGGYQAVRSSSTQCALQSAVGADTKPRFFVDAGGVLSWGAGGSSALDTTLYRSAADTLKTDDILVTSGRRLKVATAKVVGDSPYAVDSNDHVIPVDPTGGAITITLPATHSAGAQYLIKNVTSLATAITVDPSDADTIDGLATFTLAGAYAAATFVSDGTNWMVF